MAAQAPAEVDHIDASSAVDSAVEAAVAAAFVAAAMPANFVLVASVPVPVPVAYVPVAYVPAAAAVVVDGVASLGPLPVAFVFRVSVPVPGPPSVPVPVASVTVASVPAESVPVSALTAPSLSAADPLVLFVGYQPAGAEYPAPGSEAVPRPRSAEMTVQGSLADCCWVRGRRLAICRRDTLAKKVQP